MKARTSPGNLSLYWQYIRIHARSGVQYKGWWMMLVQVVFVVFSDVISTLLMFDRFGSIGEWSIDRILLIYFTAVTAFGLAEVFCRGFDTFPFGMVRKGGFDRVLLRPRPLALQVAASAFHLHRLSRPLCGLGVIADRKSVV